MKQEMQRCETGAGASDADAETGAEINEAGDGGC